MISDLLVRSELGDEERLRIYERVRSPGITSVLTQLEEQGPVLTDYVPVEQIEGTMRALRLWIEAAEAGKISHGCFVATRPEN